MKLSSLDVIVFMVAFLAIVFYIGYNFFRKHSLENLFRSGGNVHWILIGVSLIAADRSLEYIIVAPTEGFRHGFAIASYEWTASLSLIVIALFIVPLFMRAGILTLPEYLELRYDSKSRLLLSVISLIIYVIFNLSINLYVSGLIMKDLFGFKEEYTIVIAGVISASFILSGGMFSVLRTNLIIISLFTIGAVLLFIFSLYEIGGVKNILNSGLERITPIRPAHDTYMPWPQVFLGSLWIMHLSYWSFNQYIAQNYLISNSLSQAQKGILFAASLKLIYPFLFIVPGIVGYELFSSTVSAGDDIFSILIEEFVPKELKTLIVLPLMGIIISSSQAVMAAVFNIFGHDVYKRFLNRDASSGQIISASRWWIILSVTAACIIAPLYKGINDFFEYSQLINSALVPGYTVVFLFAFYVKKAPRITGVVGILTSIISFFILYEYFAEKVSILGLGGINFCIVLFVCTLITILFPLKAPVVVPEKRHVKFERNLAVVIWSILLFAVVLFIYISLM